VISEANEVGGQDPARHATKVDYQRSPLHELIDVKFRMRRENHRDIRILDRALE
jgi:hypothetical protein